MLEWDMAKPERFQMPLLVEFGGRPAEEPAAVCQAIFDSLATGRPDDRRFVRAVRDEIIVRTPADAAEHLIRHVYTPFDQFDQEELWTCLLNSRNRITHEVMVYRGTVNTVRVRVAEIFKEAVRTNAAGFVLSHCHPSGDPTPSPRMFGLQSWSTRWLRCWRFPCWTTLSWGKIGGSRCGSEGWGLGGDCHVQRNWRME